MYKSALKKQEEIRELVKRNPFELFDINFNSCYGSSAKNIFSQISIEGRLKNYFDNNEEYAHIPHLYFKIIISRVVNINNTCGFPDTEEYRQKFLNESGIGSRFIISSFKEEDKSVNYCYTKGSVFCSVPKRADFFEVLNVARLGNKFCPFIVSGNESGIKDLKSFINLNFEIESGAYIIAGKMDISDLEIESAIKDFIEAIVSGFGKEQSEKLKVLHKYADENGKRLWEDQGLQSKQYYDLENKIIKKLFKSAEKVFRYYGIKYQKTYGFSGLVNGMCFPYRKYGCLPAFLNLGVYYYYRLKKIFQKK